MKKIGVLIVSLFCIVTGSSSFAQINTQNTMTPEQLVQNILVGQGVLVSNVRYNGSLVNAQSIQGNALSFTSSSFPFSSGVYMRTNGGTGTVGYDQDLNDLATNTVTNGCIIEFDFVPSGDTISFRYMFASAEYPTYVCSGFNDVFGFFISGPGFNGTFQNNGENVALIPGGNIPVSINTVNSGTAGGAGTPSTCAAQDPNWQSNAIYYTTAYSGSTGYPYNGGTVAMTATAQVQCGQTYHIKLAISNVGDQALDSGVYLEADSFASEAVDISVATVGGDTTVIEGCTDATFYFTRPGTQADDSLIVTYDISGTATMGVDYNNLPNPVVFEPGQDSIIITLFPIADNETEAPETVTLTAMTITECGDTIISIGTLYIIDGPDLPINESDVTVYCPNDSIPVTATASGGFAPYTITWSYAGQTGTSAYVPGMSNGSYDYYVNAVDACGNTGTDTVTVIVNQTLAVDDIGSNPTASCQSTGVVWGTGTGITGQPLYHWEGPGEGGPFQIDASVMQNLPSGWYYFSIEDDVCSVNDSIFVDMEEPPVASFTALPTGGCSPLSTTFTNTSQNSTMYAWNFGNGNTLNTADVNVQPGQVYTETSIVQLIASKGACSDTAEMVITISICGCMDPNAVNYNPLANLDDGSCIYPEPTVEIPNVFSPNGDGVNDVFELKTTYATDIELTIVDRWGVVMYQGSGLDPAPIWNGAEATEGVYFYTYRIKGMTDIELEGHGFVQLFR